MYFCLEKLRIAKNNPADTLFAGYLSTRKKKL